jgi:aldose sugar dehydrogenase
MNAYLLFLMPVIVVNFVICSSIINNSFHFVSAYALGLEPPRSSEEPIINNPDFKPELVAEGLDLPTTMTFVGYNDILVLEKESGDIKRIINDTLLDEPVFHVDVATEVDRGLLGISSIKNKDGSRYVFVYFTAPNNTEETRQQFQPNSKSPSDDQVSNCLYRYTWVNGQLADPRLLLKVPANPNRHPGGQILTDGNHSVYVAIGDIDHYTKAQNIQEGPEPDGTSSILRITSDGQIVNGKGILGDEHPLNMYYAYGIRNSFGMDFDPVTGNLWDTENGEGFGDEINLVEPGFNSGWRKVQGIWEVEGYYCCGDETRDPEDLENFNGKGKYSEPEFIWKQTLAPTALVFVNSSRYGEEYEKDMIVGDFMKGNLYHFDLNEDRTELSLQGRLHDKIADDNNNELQNIIFGRGFGGITDVQIGPDNYIYVLSLYQGGHNCDPQKVSREQCIQYNSDAIGTIFRITPVQ